MNCRGHTGRPTAPFVRLLTLLVAWAAAIGWPATPWAQTPDPSTPDEVIRFRRFYVPESRISDLARRYLPMRREQFERLLRYSLKYRALDGSGWRVRLAESELQARLDDDHVLVGSGRWVVAGEEAAGAMLPLDPLNLAIREAVWEDPFGEADIAADAEECAVLWVNQPGTLKLDWSARGTRNALGDLEFALELPLAPISRLLLDLPPDLQPTISQGITERLGVVPARMSDSNSSDAAAEPGEIPEGRPSRTSPDWVRWRLEFGGQNRIRLRLAPPPEVRPPGGLAFLRQSSRYAISRVGIECRSKLTLDVYEEPLRRLSFVLPEPMRLASVHFGDQLLEPIVHPTRPNQPLEIEVAFPQPLLGVRRELQVVTLMPLPQDRSFSLPVIQVPQVNWQQGTVSLDVAGDLSLTHLRVEQGQELSVRPLPAPVFGESRQLQLYQPDSRLELRVEPIPFTVQGVVGTTVTVGPTTMMGRVTARLTARAGTPFQIEGALADFWQVDSVETVPADSLESWTLVPDESRRLVRLTLRHPMSVDKPLRVRVIAHRATPRNGVLRSDQMRIWSLLGGETRRLISLNREGPYQLKLEGDFGLLRLDPAKIPAEDQELLTTSAASLAYQDDPSRSVFSVVLSRERPAFTASSTVRVDVGRGRLTQTATLRCLPESAPLQRLLVRFSEADQGRVQWSIPGETPAPLTARRLDAEERRRAGLGEGDAWEINFRQPRTAAFDLHAERTSDFRSKRAIALVSAPEATSQSGVLFIRCPDGSPLSIDAGELPVLPVSAESATEFSLVRAAYRYNPSQDVHVYLKPSAGTSPLPAAWAPSSQLVGQIAANGSAQYLVRWNLENAGRNRVTLSFPPGCDIQSVWVDLQPTAWQAGDDGANTVWLPLPPGQRFPQIAVRFGRQEKPLGWLTKLEIPVPQIDLPCIATSTEIWVPPQYSVQDGTRRGALGPRRLTFRWPRILQTARTAPPWPWTIEAWLPRKSGSESLPGAEELALLETSVREWLDQPGPAISTWSRWLEHLAVHIAERTGKQFWVDLRAVRDLGIDPDDPVAWAMPADGLQVDTPKWVLAIGPHDIGLSSTSILGGSGIRLTELGDTGWWWSNTPMAFPGRPSPNAAGTSWVAPKDWSASPAWPWRPVGELPSLGAGDYRDWVCFRPAPTAGNALAGPWTLWVYPGQSTVALGWAMFLISTGLFAWLAAVSPRIVMPFVMLGAVVACVGPELAVPWMRGLFWGGIAALALHWVRVRCKRVAKVGGASAPGDSSPSLRRAAISAVLAAALIVGLEGGLAAQGDEPAPDAVPKADPEDLRVLIPVNEETQEPVGEYLYAPRALYDALYRLDQRPAANRPAWTIFSAEYECSLESVESNGRPVIREVKATYDLEVASDTEVRLPLWRAEANVWRATWGEETLALETDADQRDLVLRFPRAGRAPLVLQLRPVVRNESGQGEVSLTIPRVAISRLTVLAARDVDAISVPTALGHIERNHSRGTLEAELGPSSRLTMQWSNPRETTELGTDFRVEQLLWLQVQPNAVVLEARLHILGPLDQLKPVRLVTDGRLRWLPIDQPGVSVLRQVRTGDSLNLDLALRNLQEDEADVHLTFLVMGAGGVGRVSLPPLEIEGMRTSRRWVGVTVAPSLTFQQTESAEFLTPGEFTEVWGDAEAPPQVAFRLGSGNSHWGVTTRPLEPQLGARHRHDVKLAADELQIKCVTDYEVADAPVFRLLVAAPPLLQIRQVWLVAGQGGTRQPARWARESTGLIEVSLDTGVAGSLQLEVQGTLRIQPRQPLEVPLLVAQGGLVRGHSLKITRRLDVRAEVESVNGLAPVPEPGMELPADDGTRLVGNWETPPESVSAPSLRIQVAPNRPRVDGWCTTELAHDGATWWTSLDTRLEIRNGSLDVLRFDVPASWKEPLEVSPPARYALVGGSDPDRRQLIVYPQTPLTGTSRMTIRGAVLATAAEPFAVPNIVPLDIGSLPRFFVLPATWDDQELGWETSGLLESTLPAAAVANEPAGKVYQVVGPRPKAVVNALRRVSGAPRISLADVRMAVRAPGEYQGVSTFDLEPEGRRSVVVEVPKAVTLTYATVDEVPARIEPQDARSWLVALGPSQLPQRLTLVYRGHLSAASSPKAIQLAQTPWIRDLNAETTLWTVFADAREIGWKSRTTGQSNERELAAWRVSHLEKLTRKPPGFVAEEDRLAWGRPWAHRLELARAELARRDGALPPAAENRLGRQPPATATTTDSPSPANRGETLPHPVVFPEGRLLPDTVASWVASVGAQTETLCWRVAGTLPELELQPPETGWAGNWWVLGAVCGFAAAGLAMLAWTAGRYALRDLGLVSPPTLGILLGICWWLFATPAGWGWVVVIGVLFRSWWPVWWRRRAVAAR